MDFYKILEDIMQQKSISIPDVARMCNLPDSTIRSIISRKSKTVALEVAFKISKGLNVSLEELNGEILKQSDNPRSNKVSSLIKSKRKELDYSVKDVVSELSKRGIDVSEKTVYGWESGHRQPDADTFLILCDIYQIANLSDEISSSKGNEIISTNEQEVIKKYRALDEHGKMLVDNVLDLEYKRVTSEKSNNFIVDIAARGGRKEVALSEEGYKSLMTDIEKNINNDFPDIFDRREEK